MPIVQPDATSTPTAVPFLKGRRGIKDQSSVQSPIDLEISRKQYETQSYTNSMERTYESGIYKSSEDSPKKSPRGLLKKKVDGDENECLTESDEVSDGDGLQSSDGDNYNPNLGHQARQQSEGTSSVCSGWGLSVSIFIGLLMLMAALYFAESSPETQPLTLEEKFGNLEKDFRKQEEDFWRNIRVNIQEISFLDQPRTIIFLYNNKAENTLNKILHTISGIALCSLSDCLNTAVVVEGASLNTSEIVNDYGKIISKYRARLERNGVMIVKNLEKIPGVSAQAFHSFCDDQHPVVKKALILFTMKVDRLPEGYPMKFVENYLLELWKDIGKDDKFYPLFTRISGTILSVRPE